MLEGVHLVRGGQCPAHRRPPCARCCWYQDEEAHQAHFVARDFRTGGVRALDRYLRGWGIRRIQDYLVGRAERIGVPIVDGTDGEEALRSVLDLILERATAAPGAVP